MCDSRTLALHEITRKEEQGNTPNHVTVFH